MLSSFLNPTILVLLVVGHEVAILTLAAVAVIFPSRSKVALQLIDRLRWRPKWPWRKYP